MFTFRSLVREVIRGHFVRYYYYNLIKKNEFSEKNIKIYQNNRFQKIAKSLALHSTSPQKIKDEILTLPIISKSDIRKDPKKFENKSYGNIFTNYNKTSGTSGTPLKIKQSLECVHLEEAFVYRQMKWAGYSFRQRRAWIRGDLVTPIEQTQPPFWCKDYFTNTLMMSSYHISNTTSEKYIEQLVKYDPILIQAYPSSIRSLAMWLQDQNKVYQGKSLKSILTSSETLDVKTKKVIEERFNCKVFDWYGQAERVAAIGTCEKGRKHLLSDYSFVELHGDGKQEIIGTSFNNVATPLVRYATGDYAEMDSSKCECGRIFPVVRNIHGREDKIVILSDGRQIGRLDHIFKSATNIIESQIVQTDFDDFIINIVVGLDFNKEDESLIMKNAQERLGNVNIKINKCDQILRGANGKFEFIKIDFES